VRTKEALFTELGLDAPGATDALVDAMLAHPILINRPIVVTPLARACAAQPSRCWNSCPRRMRPAPTNA
jgi:arsenate reductase